MAKLSRPEKKVVTEAQAAGTRKALRQFLSPEQKATIARTDAQVAAEKARMAQKKPILARVFGSKVVPKTERERQEKLRKTR